MNLKFAVTLTFLAACAGTAFGDTINFTGTNSVLGHSATYGTGKTTVTASAFNLDGTSRLLYGKNGGGSENGIGISGNDDNEIDDLSFIQLDVSALTGPYSLSIGSTQDDEGFKVYYSNVAGSLGTLSQNILTPTSDPYTIANLSTPKGDRFVSIIADGNQGKVQNGAGNILLDSVSTTAVTPEPSSLLLLGTGIMSVVGIMRRKMAV